MKQQISVEYLGVKSTRYNRLPNLNYNHYLNLSQELRTSRFKKNQASPKLQALSNKKDDSNNYYNHTTIYNVKQNRDISKASINQELSFAKYNELQTKLMVSDFKKKVDAFLKKSNYKTNAISSKIASSLKELELLQQIKNEELLNKSLCSNKYTVKTEKKSMKAIEIFILSNNKDVTKQVISNELIQHRLLKKMEIFLKDEKLNYDLKMNTMIEQYSEIVNRIHEKAFTIKIPDKYIIQMSDYNEYYQIKEDQTDNFLQKKLEIIADQIIQEIQQSQKNTPKILSHKSSQHYDPIIQNSVSQIEHTIKTEPTILNDYELDQQNNTQLEQLIFERKISNKSKKQRKNNQQSKNDINQSQQSSLTEIHDSSYKNSNTKDNDDIRKKKLEKSKGIDQSQIDEEEQESVQKEIEKLRKQKFIKNVRAFNLKFRPKILSNHQSQDNKSQSEDSIISAKGKQKINKIQSLRFENETINLKEINEIIKIKKKQLYEYQLEKQRQENEQKEALENFIQNKNNGQQRPLNLIVNGKPFSELKDAAELWDSKRNSPRSFTKLRQNVHNSIATEQIIQEQQLITNILGQDHNLVDSQNNKIESTKILQEINTDKSINFKKIINKKLLSFEQKLNQQSLNIFDILLASNSVYDVTIDDYIIGKPPKKVINHPNFIFLQDQDEILFTLQILWRREVQQVIPILSTINKQIQVQIDSHDEYVQDYLEGTDKEEDQKQENEDS